MYLLEGAIESPSHLEARQSPSVDDHESALAHVGMPDYLKELARKALDRSYGPDSWT
jgi:hypothetical protein